MVNKKFLIVKPKYGLCNQLLSISKGIVYGIASKRDVIYSSFQLDYRNENNICEFSDIIDIIHLQEIIKKINIDINIYSDIKITGKKIETFSEEPISYLKDFIPILFYDENINNEYLDIDNPISSSIPYYYEKIYDYINLNIKFTDKYINLANDIKKSLNLNIYSCIHLRLEDDSINYMKSQCGKDIDINLINDIYKKKYLDEICFLNNIKENGSNNIYICSSLGINDNLNNDFYKQIKSKYNLIDKNDLINLDKNFNYREIYGIIDFIIAKDSIYFIGSDWSSFSMYIYNNHKNNKKNTKLIDIWNSIKNI